MLLLCSVSFAGCRQSGWEETKGRGVPVGGETLDRSIYFENAQRGVIGGYRLLSDNKSGNIDKLEMIPVLYLTLNGGRDWKLLKFGNEIRGSVHGAYLSNDTILCSIDSVSLLSEDSGKTWKEISETEKAACNAEYSVPAAGRLTGTYMRDENKKYRIKEHYTYKNTVVVVCKDGETLSDYYFISKDKGKTFLFLQKDSGSNKQKYLLKDEYLLAYESPFGLQRLKLK